MRYVKEGGASFADTILQAYFKISAPCGVARRVFRCCVSAGGAGFSAVVA